MDSVTRALSEGPLLLVFEPFEQVLFLLLEADEACLLRPGSGVGEFLGVGGIFIRAERVFSAILGVLAEHFSFHSLFGGGSRIGEGVTEIFSAFCWS
jgi:hypothetical protein